MLPSPYLIGGSIVAAFATVAAIFIAGMNYQRKNDDLRALKAQIAVAEASVKIGSAMATLGNKARSALEDIYVADAEEVKRVDNAARKSSGVSHITADDLSVLCYDCKRPAARTP